MCILNKWNFSFFLDEHFIFLLPRGGMWRGVACSEEWQAGLEWGVLAVVGHHISVWLQKTKTLLRELYNTACSLVAIVVCQWCRHLLFIIRKNIRTIEGMSGTSTWDQERCVVLLNELIVNNVCSPHHLQALIGSQATYQSNSGLRALVPGYTLYTRCEGRWRCKQNIAKWMAEWPTHGTGELRTISIPRLRKRVSHREDFTRFSSGP